MKAPRHFDTFVKKLFLFKDNTVLFDDEYINKIRAKNRVDDSVMAIFTCLHIDAFKELYEEEISDSNRFVCGNMNHPFSGDVSMVDFFIEASRRPGYARRYAISLSILAQYANNLRISEEERRRKRDEGNKIVIEEKKVSSRSEILELD